MKVIITMEEAKLPHIEFQKNKISRSFSVSLPTLLEMIEKSYYDPDEKKEREVPVFTSPALPLNTVKYSQNNRGDHIIFLYYDEFKANIKYHSDHFQQVPFPKMIFAFGIRNSSVISRYVVAIKDRFVRDDTQLFHFPYANVHGSTSLCYYEREEVKDLVQLQTFAYRWASVPINDHLYNQERSTLLNQPLRQIFEESQHQSFNYDMLVRINKTSTTPYTFEQWSSGIIGIN